MKYFIQTLKVVVFCIFCGFMVFSFSGPKDSTKEFPVVVEETLANIDTSNLEQKDNIQMKRFLSLNPEPYESIIYYKNIDTMQADEIVIVKFRSNDQKNMFRQTIEKHIEDQENIFAGYAPDEEKKLQNSILNIHANYALFVVSPNASEINKQFVTSLE